MRILRALPLQAKTAFDCRPRSRVDQGLSHSGTW
jgi:hypothetical protein